MKEISNFRFFTVNTVLFFTSFFIAANAQICNSSLGDPVVNITFGNKNNNANGNYVPSDNYIYTSSTCPEDGYYTITSSTSHCFGDSWHNILSDHTGEGNFMLVNASFPPGDFFLYTITDLCPNITYEFAAWMMNVQIPPGISPNVTFSIEKSDGTVLALYNTGNIGVTDQPTWKKFGFYFTTTSDNTDYILRMRNNATGGYGNDLAIDDITFRPCGLSISPSISGLGDTLDICESNSSSFRFTATLGPGFLNPVYQWQESADTGNTWKDINGATSLAYQYSVASRPGKYLYRLTVVEQSVMGLSKCRVASRPIIINVIAKPEVNAGEDRFLLKGDTLNLSGIIQGKYIKYYWSPPNYLSGVNELNPVASPPIDFIYTLNAESMINCRNTDQVRIQVINDIYVPTAFTPNNDGKNDHWHIPFLKPSLGAMVNVYNRYGQIVYQANGIDVDWDGTVNGIPQPAATYIYIIKFKKTWHDMKGTITLLR